MERECILEFVKIYISITNYVSRGMNLGSLNFICFSKVGMIPIFKRFFGGVNKH